MKFTICWLGQAGYLIEVNGCRICIDPYLSNTVEAAEGLKRLFLPPVTPQELNADCYIITHHHLDHFDCPTLGEIPEQKALYIGPPSCTEGLKAMGKQAVITVKPGDEIRLPGGILMHAVYALHTEDSIGVILQEEGKREGGLYLTGDTEYSEELLKAKAYRPEILITCINGKLGNMDVQAAARLAVGLEVETVIPCHYGMFAENTEDPEKLKTALCGSGAEYRELRLMVPEEFSM